jgi:RsiW-degrading membrane proteinase PrsW (M82 family)
MALRLLPILPRPVIPLEEEEDPPNESLAIPEGLLLAEVIVVDVVGIDDMDVRLDVETDVLLLLLLLLFVIIIILLALRLCDDNESPPTPPPVVALFTIIGFIILGVLLFILNF